MQRNFKCERAWSEIERSGLLQLWAVEQGCEHPRVRGVEILTAHMLWSVAVCRETTHFNAWDHLTTTAPEPHASTKPNSTAEKTFPSMKPMSFQPARQTGESQANHITTPHDRRLFTHPDHTRWLSLTASAVGLAARQKWLKRPTALTMLSRAGNCAVAAHCCLSSILVSCTT